MCIHFFWQTLCIYIYILPWWLHVSVTWPASIHKLLCKTHQPTCPALPILRNTIGLLPWYIKTTVHSDVNKTAVKNKHTAETEKYQQFTVQNSGHMENSENPGLTLRNNLWLNIYIYRVAQKNVYTLWHEKYYSVIVATVFIQKQNWYERCPWILDSITLSPWNRNFI